MSTEEYEAMHEREQQAAEAAAAPSSSGLASEQRPEYESAAEREAAQQRFEEQQAEAAQEAEEQEEQRYFAAEEEQRRQSYLKTAANAAAARAVEYAAAKAGEFGVLEFLWYSLLEVFPGGLWALPLLTIYVIAGFFSDNPFLHQLPLWKKLVVILVDLLVLLLLVMFVMIFVIAFQFPECAQAALQPKLSTILLGPGVGFIKAIKDLFACVPSS